MKKEKLTQAQTDALLYLKKHVKKDTKLIIQVVSVSNSGMTRKMNAFVIVKNKFTKQHELVKLNWFLKQLGAVNLDTNGLIRVGGCGMDMTFALQDQIKHAIFSRKKYCRDLPQVWQAI
jgi:hypothetical protein